MPSVETKAQRPAGREGVYLAALVAIAVIMYIPTFGYLVHKWRADAQYSLAFLVPFVSGYFVWKKWPEVKRLERSPCAWGLAVIVLALILHLGGVILDVSGPSGVSVLLSLLGGCLYFHGTALVRTLAFPLAYTVFMIPVPGGV
ncbi:MAG: exosortase/archaeosortase family protein, partial [Armatimonadota bacterium]